MSFFGTGRGECIVVHLGQGDWLIVDSCLNRQTGRPVALEYLSSLGVDYRERIRMVVATHWHDDHIRGLSQVVREAEDSEFVCSAALRRSEFIKFVLAGRNSMIKSGSGTDEFLELIDYLRSVRQGRRGDIGKCCV